jgi:Holliday junction resolvase RusA-like endonuclease
MSFTFTIDQVPVPQARARITRWGSYDPKHKEKASFVKEIKEKWPYEPLKNNLYIHIIFFMPISKSTPKKKRLTLVGINHQKKPDVSNLFKFVEDCMSKIVYEDDAQIYKIVGEKYYDANPRMLVTVTTYEEMLNKKA